MRPHVYKKTNDLQAGDIIISTDNRRWTVDSIRINRKIPPHKENYVHDIHVSNGATHQIFQARTLDKIRVEKK